MTLASYQPCHDSLKLSWCCPVVSSAHRESLGGGTFLLQSRDFDVWACGICACSPHPTLSPPPAKPSHHHASSMIPECCSGFLNGCSREPRTSCLLRDFSPKPRTLGSLMHIVLSSSTLRKVLKYSLASDLFSSFSSLPKNHKKVKVTHYPTPQK